MANNKPNRKKPNHAHKKNHNKGSYGNFPPKQREEVKEITYSGSLTVGELADLIHRNSMRDHQTVVYDGNDGNHQFDAG